MGMDVLLTRPDSPAKVLVLLNAGVLFIASVSMLLLLLASPPYECGVDYASPPTPAHSGAAALGSFLWGVAVLLVASGLRIGGRRNDRERPWATRAIWTAVAIVLVGGVGLGAVVTHWTCWP
jgi:hypothetical protein